MNLLLSTLLLALACTRVPSPAAPVTTAGTGGTSATGGTGPVATGGSTAVIVTRCDATVRTAPVKTRVRPLRSRGPLRVVGGKRAADGAWPAALALTTADDWPYCGGTLIAPRWVLTARHCEVQPGERAVVGTNDLDRGGGRIPVSEVLDHPGADVTLAKLEAPATAGHAAPALLVPETWVGGTDTVSITGWGLTSEGGEGSRYLLEARVPLLTYEACSAAYPGEIQWSELCAGFAEGGVDTCQGDSGGGLYSGSALAGVVSWGNGCARPGKPGVYVAITAVWRWVMSCVEIYGP